MENIAIYGASFNPPTLAHTSLVQQVLTKTHINKIIINPSGLRKDKNFGISSKKRRGLINLYFENLQNLGLDIEVDNYFFDGKNGENTSTFEEGHYFKNKLGFDPEFIFGNDVIPNMPKWSGNKNKYIENILKKIFIPRAGYDFNASDFGITNYVNLEDINIPDISSTIAREMIKTKQLTENILQKNISKYIQQNGLYI